MRKSRISNPFVFFLCLGLLGCQNLSSPSNFSQGITNQQKNPFSPSSTTQASAKQSSSLSVASPLPISTPSPSPSPSPTLSPRPTPLPSPKVKPVLATATSAVDYGETVLLTGSGFTPNGSVEVLIAYPSTANFNGLFTSFRKKSNDQGKLEFQFSKSHYEGGVSVRNPGESDSSPESFVGIFKVILIDATTQIRSEMISFEIKKPPSLPVNPSLKFETDPTDEPGSTWLKVTGSGFSAQGEVRLKQSSPQGISLESTKIANLKGEFRSSLIVRTDLTKGEYCFEAEDLSTGKQAQPACKTL
ncbi:MAG: hypothetical protein IV090_24860 [Candidatus Sericytochromatia bacterium]|nr:hypothetical protein [Candidatus Sericytochromatia bacterium]